MGIHCGYEKNNKKNIGIYFKEIIKNIDKKVINSMDIKLNINNINKKDILLFNQNRCNREEIKDKFKVYLNKKTIEINNVEDKYIINNNYYEINENVK